MRTVRNIFLAAALVATALAGLAAPVLAQSCVGVAQAPGQPLLHRARHLPGAPIPHAGLLQLAQAAQLTRDEVRLTFVGHSTFLIESPKGVRIVTDYNDYVRSDVVPDIATMNVAHDSHFSTAPDPAIKHVLRGWNPNGGPAIHDFKLADVHVRNIPTNTRDWSGGTREFGNSIFVFEINGLCIAHLGHLHHTLTVQQLGQIGQMDVLLVPVDGGYTLDLDGMLEVLKAIKAPIMIPMHMFSTYGLERFLGRVRGTFEIVEKAVPTLVVSRRAMPGKQQVVVLPGH